MAYVSYKDKNKSGHYDWNILIALLLFLVAIIAFVIYKVFILSDSEATPVTSQPVIQKPAEVEPTSEKPSLSAKKTEHQPVVHKEQVIPAHTESKTVVQPNHSGSIASQHEKSASEVKDEQLLSEPVQTKPAQKPSLKCSSEDQKAGLCN